MLHLKNIANNGNVPVSTNEQVDKFGRVLDIDTGDSFPQDIWQGVSEYPGFPSGAEAMEVLSSSVNDTAAGTGARTVTIGNLRDLSGNAMPDVTVTLNGTTPVTLGTQLYHRSSRLRVTTVGSGGVNAGTITLRHSTTTANIFAVIPIGLCTSLLMAYTVPVGKTLYIAKGVISLARASGAAASASIGIKTRSPDADSPFVTLRSMVISNDNSYHFPSHGFFVVQERFDFKISVEDVSDNDVNIAAEFDGYLLDS